MFIRSLLLVLTVSICQKTFAADSAQLSWIEGWIETNKAQILLVSLEKSELTATPLTKIQGLKKPHCFSTNENMNVCLMNMSDDCGNKYGMLSITLTDLNISNLQLDPKDSSLFPIAQTEMISSNLMGCTALPLN